MSQALPSDAVLPPGSLVLITGVNGYVGSNIADMCVAYGCKVRGAVRDLEKNAWMVEYFDENYGPGTCELAWVNNLTAVGGLDEAVKDCAGVVASASNVTFSPDPTIVIPESVSMVVNAMESAAKQTTVKRFVFTSSSAAVAQDIYDKPFDLSPDHWNETMVQESRRPPPYGPDRIIETYAASLIPSPEHPSYGDGSKGLLAEKLIRYYH